MQKGKFRNLNLEIFNRAVHLQPCRTDSLYKIGRTDTAVFGIIVVIILSVVFEYRYIDILDRYIDIYHIKQ